LDIKTIQKRRKKIKRGQYFFNPAREVFIPKPGKKENRPLKIANPKEKLVQKAMELVINS